MPVGEVPPERRSSVALFCYRRSHLEEAALAVAATCDEEVSSAQVVLSAARFSSSRRKAPSPAKNKSLNSLSALALSIASMKSSQDDNEEEDAGLDAAGASQLKSPNDSRHH